MKKIMILVAAILVLVGCSPSKEKERFNGTFYQTFDTQIMYLEYADSEEVFNENYRYVQDEYQRLHELYDNYRIYDGVNNVMTINQNAGKEPVKVEKDLFDLIKFALDNYDKTLGYTNIAMGRVLEIWHDVREEAADLPEDQIVLPSQEDLEEANEHSIIENIELDEANSTVFIKDPQTMIDLGAVAKGYATELVARGLEARGVEHASINAGGNVRTIGHPGDGRQTWGIALQHPDPDSSEYLDVLYLDGSYTVVTSGDYQRYFEKDGKRYHHLISPKTLWPESKYRAVSVITKDSGLADLLSTSLYLATKEEAEEIIKNYEGIEVLWAFDDHTENTPGLDSIMASKGAQSK